MSTPLTDADLERMELHARGPQLGNMGFASMYMSMNMTYESMLALIRDLRAARAELERLSAENAQISAQLELFKGAAQQTTEAQSVTGTHLPEADHERIEEEELTPLAMHLKGDVPLPDYAKAVTAYSELIAAIQTAAGEKDANIVWVVERPSVVIRPYMAVPAVDHPIDPPIDVARIIAAHKELKSGGGVTIEPNEDVRERLALITGETVVSEPGAPLTVKTLHLSDKAREMLTTSAPEIDDPAPAHDRAM